MGGPETSGADTSPLQSLGNMRRLSVSGAQAVAWGPHAALLFLAWMRESIEFSYSAPEATEAVWTAFGLQSTTVFCSITYNKYYMEPFDDLRGHIWGTLSLVSTTSRAEHPHQSTPVGTRSADHFFGQAPSTEAKWPASVGPVAVHTGQILLNWTMPSNIRPMCTLYTFVSWQPLL